MMRSTVRWIMTDLDGTLLRSDQSISGFTLGVLEACRAKGVKLAIATARSESEAKRFIDVLRPDGAVLNAGALVKLGEVTVYRRTVAARTAQEMLAAFGREPAVRDITVETDGGYYWNCDDIPSLGPDYAHAKYYDFRTPFLQAAYKITVRIVDEALAKRFEARFTQCGMMRFRDEDWYRFAHPEATKLAGVAALAGATPEAMAEVIAFGDEELDMQMLAQAGIGVAVDNATPGAMHAAAYRTASNDEDGVARFLQRYVLSE